MSIDNATPEEWYRVGEKLRSEKIVDPVAAPAHYNQGCVECIDALEAMLTPEEFLGYCRGNSFKYRWRFRDKNGMQDLKKAKWYENKIEEHLIKTREGGA